MTMKKGVESKIYASYYKSSMIKNIRNVYVLSSYEMTIKIFEQINIQSDEPESFRDYANFYVTKIK